MRCGGRISDSQGIINRIISRNLADLHVSSYLATVVRKVDRLRENIDTVSKHHRVQGKEYRDEMSISIV